MALSKASRMSCVAFSLRAETATTDGLPTTDQHSPNSLSPSRWASVPPSGLIHSDDSQIARDAVAGLVGIAGGVVSGVINLESSGVEAPDWRPRHDEHYHEA